MKQRALARSDSTMDALVLPRTVLASFAWLVLSLVLMFGANARLFAVQALVAFDQANKLYEEGKYAEAAAAYAQLAQGDHASAAIYFNLGNAWFKARQPGRAIAAYRRAERLAPRDPDVKANLNFVRKYLNETAPPGSWRQRWLGRLALDEWSIAASAAFWLWLGLLAVGELRIDWRKRLRAAVIANGLVACALLLCLGLLWFDQATMRSAVVVVPEAVVRYGPLDESQSAFQLRDGAEIVVLDEKGDWLEVRDAARRDGWLKRDQVVVLTSDAKAGSTLPQSE
jgi:tetratricopeptide (TPR) repeat protein